MMMLSESASLLTVLIASVAAMAVGFLWYSPMLFGNQWMKLMGLTKASMEKAKKSMGSMYALSWVGGLVTAWVLSMVFSLVGVINGTEGAQVAFWMWLGFVAPVQMTEVLFGGKSWNLFAINTGYQLAAMIVMGVILTMWG